MEEKTGKFVHGINMAHNRIQDVLANFKYRTVKKRDKIIYWIATLWLALGMTVTGIVQVLKIPSEIEFILQMGYPIYFLTILGTWKILGVIAILLPKFPLLKEWAYAGFFFAMSGAVFSHMATGSEASEYFGPILLLILMVTSWYFRPPDRKLYSSIKL